MWLHTGSHGFVMPSAPFIVHSARPFLLKRAFHIKGGAFSIKQNQINTLKIPSQYFSSQRSERDLYLATDVAEAEKPLGVLTFIQGHLAPCHLPVLLLQLQAAREDQLGWCEAKSSAPP